MSDIQLDADLEAASNISDAATGDTIVLYATVDSNKGGVISLSLTDAEVEETEDEEEEDMPMMPKKKNNARMALDEEE